MKSLTLPVLVASMLISAALAPWGIQAAQRALTVDSLEKAYKVRLSVIDTELASTTVAINALVVPNLPPFTDYMNKRNSLQQESLRLKGEREATIAAYNLLEEAFK